MAIPAGNHHWVEGVLVRLKMDRELWVDKAEFSIKMELSRANKS